MTMRRVISFALVALAAARLGTFAGLVAAEPHPFYVCRGFVLSQRFDPTKLEVRCPGDTIPWMTFTDCPKATIAPDRMGGFHVQCPKFGFVLIPL